jgi:hypothetical protein
MNIVWIIWRGKGWQVALATFLCSLVAEIITRYVTNDENFYQNNPYIFSISLLISSIIAYSIYSRLKKDNDAKNLVGEAEANRTNDPINSSINKIHKINDSLFFIPVKYWSWILLTFSIVNIFLK